MIYLKNIPAKFHPDPIWNDGPLAVSEEGRLNKNKNNKMNSDMGSVPDPKIGCKTAALVPPKQLSVN